MLTEYFGIPSPRESLTSWTTSRERALRKKERKKSKAPTDDPPQQLDTTTLKHSVLLRADESNMNNPIYSAVIFEYSAALLFLWFIWQSLHSCEQQGQEVLPTRFSVSLQHEALVNEMIRWRGLPPARTSPSYHFVNKCFTIPVMQSRRFDKSLKESKLTKEPNLFRVLKCQACTKWCWNFNLVNHSVN